MSTHEFRRYALVLCLVLVAVAYLPSTVRILRTDDFIRIMENRTLDGEYFRELLLTTKTDDFYRPLNHLSFGLCHHLFGMSPGGYAAFNAALVFGCVLLLFSLLDSLASGPSLAAWTVFAWLLNVDTVIAPLWWASGRTTSLAAFFFLLAAWAVVRAGSGGRRAWLALAGASAFLALLSKESATTMVLLLPVLALWLDRRERGGPSRTPGVVLGVLAGLLVYGWLRLEAGGVLPWTAPQHYRYDMSLRNVVSNLWEYLVDSLRFSALAIPALLIVQRGRAGSSSWKLRFSRRTLLLVGLGLFAVGIAPTLALPKRSSLYPFLPSVFVVLVVVGSVLKVPEDDGAAELVRRRSLAAMVLLGLCVAPFAWLEGAQRVRENRQIYDWSLEVAPEVIASGARTVAIRYDPAPAGAPRPRDFEYLEFALQAHTGRVVPVLLNPDTAPEGTPWWELAPDPAGERATLLRRLDG